MEIIKILRKNMPLFVRQMLVGELDKSKCSHKFLSHNLKDEVIVNVKCYEDGTLDLRGKKEEYRIIVPDKDSNNIINSYSRNELTERTTAMEWWNSLPMYNMDNPCKRTLSYRYYDREPGNLTGSEIQRIYESENKSK